MCDLTDHWKISIGINIGFTAKSIECKGWVSKYVSKPFIWTEGAGETTGKILNTAVYTSKLNMISSKISQNNVDVTNVTALTNVLQYAVSTSLKQRKTKSKTKPKKVV